MVVVFEDIYGNRWDLYQNKQIKSLRVRLLMRNRPQYQVRFRSEQTLRLNPSALCQKRTFFSSFADSL